MKINLALFFGGASVEHEISVISALQAAGCLNKEKYNIVPVYITKDHRMFTGDELLNIENFKNIPELLQKSTPCFVTNQGSGAVIIPVAKDKGKKLVVDEHIPIDMALPVVHGTNCEDGSLQGFFEILGIPYVGCDVMSSAAGMDKIICKNVLEANGVPVLPCVSFTSREWANDTAEVTGRIEKLGYPVIVKPANLGSSVGISKVDSHDELAEKVSLAASFAEKLLVEHAVTELREINCSVKGDIYSCEASLCEEPVMSDEILSYKDKYLSGGDNKGMSGLSRKIPADLSKEKTDEIIKIAEKTFVSLGCSGVARIDFLIDSADNDRVYVNEINTIPGSLSFYLWEPKGVKYSALLDDIIETGFARQRRRDNLMFTYNTNILSTGSFGKKGGKK